MPKPKPIASSDAEAVVSAMGMEIQNQGGKVDADAIVALAQRARELGLEADDDQELRTVRFELKHDLDKRLDKYLTDRIAFLSRTQLQRLIDEGGVTVNAKPAKASLKVNAGDIIEVVVPPPPSKDITPEDIPLEVMFEDEHLIVINKQPDIIVHPARSENTGTMLGALAYHFKYRSSGGLSEVGKDFARPGVVHRLDRNTSGVIVFAKTDEAHWKLGHQFEHRSVDKRYLAIVHGLVEPDVQVIDLPIGPHQSREKGYREKYVVRHDELGKPSVTIARVRERYVLGGRDEETKRRRDEVGKAASTPSLRLSVSSSLSPSPGWSLPDLPRRVDVAAGGPTNPFEADMERFSLVELELKTGRTHQIRVHLSHNLWPIVGDDMYGGKVLTDEVFGIRNAAFAKPRTSRKPASLSSSAESRTPNLVIARQALHATTLAFDHPITKRPLSFTAPLRGDMASLVHALRAGSAGGEQIVAQGATICLEKVCPAQKIQVP
jgi:RluA family pseudouridine synthase